MSENPRNSQIKLADKTFEIRRVTGREEISALFQYEVALSSKDASIVAETMLGCAATISIQSTRRDGTTDNGGTPARDINGIVASFGRDPDGDTYEFTGYRALIVPSLHLAALGKNCRVFQKLSVCEIVEQLVKTELGLEIRDATTASGKAAKDFRVQYNESDFDFLSRLLEAEGIYYFFEHTGEKHTLVLCDDANAHATPANSATVPLRPDTGSLDEQCVRTWHPRETLLPVSYTGLDFNPEKPAATLTARQEITRRHTRAPAQVTEFPAGFQDTEAGDALVKRRAAALQTRHATYQGQTDALELAPGAKFKLDAGSSPFTQEYLVTECAFTFVEQSLAGGHGSLSAYAARITAIPLATNYSPARKTPLPDVSGAHTATVVAAKGDEILADPSGAVKVQFHWDTRGQRDENSSAFLRTAQMLAGNTAATLFLPRAGQEVIVQFLNRDPDRPIITGSLYNGLNKPPYEIPAEKTRSYIRTESYEVPEGEMAGYNEILFEDKKDAEHLSIHASRNMEHTTVKDSHTLIGNDAHHIVKHDALAQVRNDSHHTIGGNQIIEIGAGSPTDKDEAGEDLAEVPEGGGQFLKIKGPRGIEIEGKSSLHVKDDTAEKFEKDRAVETVGQFSAKAKIFVIEATENLTLKVGGDSIVISKDGIEITTGKDLKIKAANIDAKTDQNVKMEATQNVEIKGTAGVKIESSANLDLKATASLALEGTAGATLKTPAQLTLESNAMTTLKTTGILTIQGSLVNIN